MPVYETIKMGGKMEGAPSAPRSWMPGPRWLWYKNNNLQPIPMRATLPLQLIPAQLRVRIIDGPPALVSIDGRDDYPIEAGDQVEIRALERPLRFIEPSHALPFWELLRQKAQLLPA